ncbi:MAG: peptide chain release factor N(5)-glutamine methyltransferase [Gemmatimonadales bacterium]|nr:MAG: peptide chain release factor N(5)-glutamine methyltransferase [Gemmatimonadales bacterium]
MTEDVRPRFDDPVDPPPSGTPWTVLRLLRWSTQYLDAKGVEGGRLDVEHLLADTLGVGRLDLYTQFERPLQPEELSAFRPRLLERARHRPLQYILGRASFREIELQVDERVLVPRPETEELVGAVLSRVREWGRDDLVALDLGTGSGAIALSLLVEGPFSRVWATDSSADALEVAEANAASLDLSRRVTFARGDLFQPLPDELRADVLVSNPPYISPGELASLQPEVRLHEPEEALVAPGDGLAILERIVDGAGEVLMPGGLLALEVGAGQAPAVVERLEEARRWGTPVVLRDLGHHERIVLATLERERDPAGSPRGTN